MLDRWHRGQRLSVLYVHNTVDVKLGSLDTMDVDQAKVVTEHWSKFIKAISDKTALINFFSGGILSEEAKVIRDFITGPFEITTLLSLSILCQGYLVVCALSEDMLKAIGPKDIMHMNKALKRMGCTTSYQESFGRKVLIDALCENKSLIEFCSNELRRSNIMQADGDYWKPLSDEQELKGKVVREWTTININKLPKSVDWLVSTIEDNKSIDQPGMVAHAYIDIVEAMKGK